jgi:NAD(P)-dependent dehydrogenase (short-subunit alcohol dehydrogenase family)
MSATVLITGVTAGIGLALAREFARGGHTVVGCGRSPEKLAALQAELGPRHLLSVVDVGCAGSVGQWASDVYDRCPGIDLLINNAAVKGELCRLWESRPDDFEQVIRTNVCGVANVVRSFAPRMVAAARGAIINLSSEWGRTADACVASYCASKFAVEGLTRSLAKELPQGMVAVALSPLIVWTDLLEQCKDLLLPGEYELGVTPETWARFAVPKMLTLNQVDNGASLTWSPHA